MQFFSAIERRRGARNLQSDGTDRRSMRDVMRMREAFFFLIDDEVDRALGPSRHRFRFVARNVVKAESRKKLAELLSGAVVHRKLDKLDAETLRP